MKFWSILCILSIVLFIFETGTKSHYDTIESKIEYKYKKLVSGTETFIFLIDNKDIYVHPMDYERKEVGDSHHYKETSFKGKLVLSTLFSIFLFSLLIMFYITVK